MKRGSNCIFLISILITTLFMGSSFPTGKYLIVVEKTPPLLLGGVRFIIAGLVMLVLSFLFGKGGTIIPKSQGSKIKGVYIGCDYRPLTEQLEPWDFLILP